MWTRCPARLHITTNPLSHAASLCRSGSLFFLSRFSCHLEKKRRSEEVRTLWTPQTTWKLWKLEGRCYPEQVAPSWHALHLHNAWSHASSDVSLAVLPSLPHAVSLPAAAPCQTVSVPTPQAWGNGRTRVRLPPSLRISPRLDRCCYFQIEWRWMRERRKTHFTFCLRNMIFLHLQEIPQFPRKKKMTVFNVIFSHAYCFFFPAFVL